MKSNNSIASNKSSSDVFVYNFEILLILFFWYDSKSSRLTTDSCVRNTKLNEVFVRIVAYI